MLLGSTTSMEMKKIFVQLVVVNDDSHLESNECIDKNVALRQLTLLQKRFCFSAFQLLINSKKQRLLSGLAVEERLILHWKVDHGPWTGCFHSIPTSSLYSLKKQRLRSIYYFDSWMICLHLTLHPPFSFSDLVLKH